MPAARNPEALNLRDDSEDMCSETSAKTACFKRLRVRLREECLPGEVVESVLAKRARFGRFSRQIYQPHCIFFLNSKEKSNVALRGQPFHP